MVVIGIDLYNKSQPSDQIIELTWRENLVLCNAINNNID